MKKIKEIGNGKVTYTVEVLILYNETYGKFFAFGKISFNCCEEILTRLSDFLDENVIIDEADRIFNELCIQAEKYFADRHDVDIDKFKKMAAEKGYK